MFSLLVHVHALAAVFSVCGGDLVFCVGAPRWSPCIAVSACRQIVRVGSTIFVLVGKLMCLRGFCGFLSCFWTICQVRNGLVIAAIAEGARILLFCVSTFWRSKSIYVANGTGLVALLFFDVLLFSLSLLFGLAVMFSLLQSRPFVSLAIDCQVLD